ncbi:sodium/proton antiporter, CPA1 family [Chitinophaga sp. YR627]|uniref:Na+/H+ antiporter n=1 Tax=Chitinophaga sp. YR627 TaxID=1881041 RepID=UPI0008EFEB34|nr:Na+/H+ antiporter [Chitinophaga sp. YR627]SFO85808.1 sodium/proton antiporter, CPA1 family [Chitinophaga sp. YR627]
MQHFEAVILILAILVGLSAIADKVKVPFPILLVITGAIVGIIPRFPLLVLDPPVVFLLFLPPLLYDAASHTSWHEFKAEMLPISTLAIALVFFTTITVAGAAYYFIPEFSLPLAFALGAIVSPPDAVAATGITKGLQLNRRVTTILEGESLVNDASALIAYRFSYIAIVTGSFVFWEAGLQFLLLVCGGALSGALTGFIFVLMHEKIKRNSIVSTSLTLLTPFVSYLLAEMLHTSGVLAVVSTGLFISWRSPRIFSYQTRMRSKSVWDTLIFILNGFIFLLIGQQLPMVLRDLEKYSFEILIFYGLIISLVVITVRLMWVFATAYSQHIFKYKMGGADFKNIHSERVNTWKNVLIVGWTGTRGIVSMATALSLPLTMEGGIPFPQRSLILFLTFVVIFVTLVIQGLSLPILIRILGVTPTNRSYKNKLELQLFLAQSIIHFIENDLLIHLDTNLKDQVKARYEATVNQLLKEAETENDLAESSEAHRLLIPLAPIMTAEVEISKFRRELLIRLHEDGSFDHQTIKQLEQELDVDDLKLNKVLKREDE